MKVSRKEHTTRAADGGLKKAAWAMLMRFSRSSGKKSARLIKWRGGVERFEANTHDQKERQDWPFDDEEDDWAKYVEGYQHEREAAYQLEEHSVQIRASKFGRKRMPKVGIDIYDAALLCGVVCDFLYLNEKNSRKLRSDHEKIEAAKDRLGAALQKLEEEMWKEFRKGAHDVECV